MKTFALTKIVPICLLMALCACTDNVKNERTRVVPNPEGMNSKLGKTLTLGTWCKASAVTAAGVVTLEKMVFSSNGTVTKTNYILLSNSSLNPQEQSIGTWSIIDTSLVLMQAGQKPMSLLITKTTREADGENCLSLTQDNETGTTEQICPCN